MSACWGKQNPRTKVRDARPPRLSLKEQPWLQAPKMQSLADEAQKRTPTTIAIDGDCAEGQQSSSACHVAAFNHCVRVRPRGYHVDVATTTESLAG